MALPPLCTLSSTERAAHVGFLGSENRYGQLPLSITNIQPVPTPTVQESFEQVVHKELPIAGPQTQAFAQLPLSTTNTQLVPTTTVPQ